MRLEKCDKCQGKGYIEIEEAVGIEINVRMLPITFIRGGDSCEFQ